MPTPYNKDFTVLKSAQLQALDCRPTGATKMVGNGDQLTFVGTYLTAEAIEPGECISLVRVPAGFQVTGGRLAFGSGSNAVIGVGDPHCCGRLLGPILMTGGSQIPNTVNPNGFDCMVIMKTNLVTDGCGLGYVYTCATDIILSNGYGELSFGIGGGKSGTASGGIVAAAAIASGTSIFFRLEGQIVPNPNA